MENIEHARSFEGLQVDVFLNHYDTDKDGWLEPPNAPRGAGNANQSSGYNGTVNSSSSSTVDVNHSSTYTDTVNYSSWYTDDPGANHSSGYTGTVNSSSSYTVDVNHSSTYTDTVNYSAWYADDANNHSSGLWYTDSANHSSEYNDTVNYSAWYADNVNYSSSHVGIKFNAARALLADFDVSSYEWIWFLDEDADFRHTDLELMIQDARSSGSLILTPSIVFDPKDRPAKTVPAPARAPARAPTRAPMRAPPRAPPRAPARAPPASAHGKGGPAEKRHMQMESVESLQNSTEHAGGGVPNATRHHRAWMRRLNATRHRRVQRLGANATGHRRWQVGYMESNATRHRRLRMTHEEAIHQCQEGDGNCDMQAPHKNCKYRHTGFVEMTFPLMRPQAYNNTAGTCKFCLHNLSDWGLDQVWCALAAKQTCSNRKTACAVLDRVSVTHRNFKTLPKWKEGYLHKQALQANREAQNDVSRQYPGLTSGVAVYDCISR